MQIELTTYAFEIDEAFTERKIDGESGSVWAPAASPRTQPPIFNFALSEVVDLPDDPTGGGDYGARVRAYFDIKRPGVIAFEDRVVEIGGRRALVRTLEYRRRVTSDVALHNFALFVNLRLDDEFMQEFSADCPIEARADYEPRFWEAIESYRFAGGARAAIDAQEAARAEMYARIDRLVARSAELGGTAAEDGGSDGVAAPEPDPFVAPTDGAEQLSIEGFEVGTEACRATIAELAGTLLVEIPVVFSDPAEAAAAKLLSPYAEAGRARIEISASGVYGADGTPVGRIGIEDGRDPARRATVRLHDFEIGLEFSGALEFVDGWASLRGVLGVSYDDAVRFPIEIARRLDTAALDWSRYQFLEIDEIDRAPADVVQRIQLTELDEGADLSRLARCTAATHLFLRHRSWGEPRPVTLPALAFPRLESLTIHSIELPDARLGALTNLTRLSIMSCGLGHVDEGTWHLPRLEFLTLSDNALETIPEALSLPALRSLDLRGNRLRALPRRVFEQPALRTLDLRDNPLESLPEQANDPRFEIRLEIDARRRLLDHVYRGADGQGATPWDDRAFAAASDPGLAAAVDEALAASAAGTPHREALRGLVRRAIGLRLGPAEDYAGRGNHRVGGMPDLPPSIPYPRFAVGEGDDRREGVPYEFLCQLDCAALAPLQDYLPRTGFLYFFLSTMHDVYGGSPPRTGRVHWFDGPREALGSGAQVRIPAASYFEMTTDAYEARRLEASAIASPPHFYAAASNPHLFRGAAAGLGDDLDLVEQIDEEFCEPLRRRFPCELGVATHGFTQHEDPEHQAALALKGGPEEWIVLLQVSSCGDFTWGDAGDLFFVIHRSDLARRDFRNVFCTIESS